MGVARHAALVERRARWQAFAQKLRTVCDPHVIVLGDEVEHVFSRLYAGGTPVEAHRININADIGTAPIIPALRQYGNTIVVGEGPAKLEGMVGITRGKTYVMLAKSHFWPGDPVAFLLSLPAYADYKMVADPDNMSIYDKTPIPPDRTPTFGCPG